MHSLTCQLCGSILDADKLDRRLAIITCSHCGGIYDLTKERSDRVDNRSTRIGIPSVSVTTERAPAALPEKFTIEKDNNSFSVSWRWFEYYYLFLIFFASFWNISIFSSIFSRGHFDFFLTAHVAIGFATAYTALAGVMNTTRISVDSKTLRVQHFPWPWFPAPVLDVIDIEQIYVVEKYKEDKKGNRTFHYNVNAVMRDNTNKTLLKGLPSVDQGLYLEQEFETFLGIRDRAVAGEVTSKGFKA